MIRDAKQGFTLIELMLAMTFISILLLSITMVGIQAGRMYSRGVVLRDVNQAGRDISDMFRRDFLQANAGKINITGLRVPNNENWTTGRLCLGTHSYVWNNPKYLDNPSLLGANRLFKVDGNPINLVRVVDADGGLCKRDGSGRYPETVDMAKSSNLLRPISSGDGSIGIHNVTLEKITSDSSREALYRLTFTLGTSKMSEIRNSSCKAPDETDSNFEFCAINKFEMIVRTNG
mgnify:FL=1